VPWRVGGSRSRWIRRPGNDSCAAEGAGEGFEFVAFGASLDAFEVQLTRMSGLEDGTVDALFRFSRPVTGAYFWCPPVKDGQLNLAAVGL